MAERLPLVKHGDEIGLILPDALLAKMEVDRGDTIWLVEDADGFSLRTSPPKGSPSK